MAAKSSKNEMLIFRLHLTSDDQLRSLSDESHPKYKRNGHQIIKNLNTHFWIMFNFWWLAKQYEQ